MKSMNNMIHHFRICPISTNKKLENFISSTQKELENFFHTKIEPVNIFLIDSRKDIDKIWGKKTEKWLTAWTKNNNIFILNLKNYIRESDHKDIKHFWQALKHECSHLYFKQLTQANYPKWLNEGLACYLAGQIKKHPVPEEALRVFDYFQKTDREIYAIAYFWVKLLIDRFGKGKILELVSRINSQMTEKQFRKNFYRVYGINYSKKDLEALL